MVRTRCNILGERLQEYNVRGADQKVNPNINSDINYSSSASMNH